MPPASARGPGWGSLPEDLVCAVAALLPVRERYGALPLLNRHFHATSQRWPIECGVYQLAEPAGRITKKGIERRSQGLLRWLSRHSDQLQLCSDDVPVALQLAVAGQQTLHFDDKPLLTLLQPTVAAILQQHCGALVNLTLWLPDPSQAAGQSSSGMAGGPSPLEGHDSLTRLRLRNFRGSAADLAGLLAPATQLGQLELVISDFQMHPQLLAGMPSQPALCRLLKVLKFNNSSYRQVHAGQLFPSMAQGLLACTSLCSLNLDLIDDSHHSNTYPELPVDISRLSRLTDLSLAAVWTQVPEVLSQLPLRWLTLSHCKLGSAVGAPVEGPARVSSRSSGMPQSLRALAPTLKHLSFEECNMSSLPIVVSCFTGLTSLILYNNKNLSDVPSWLAALTGLKMLQYSSAVLEDDTRLFPAVLDALPSLHNLTWQEDPVYTIRQGAYLSRLTSLTLCCHPENYWDDHGFLDISALKDASSLLDLSLAFNCDDPRGALRGAHALAGLSLTSLCLSELRATVLPPDGAYLSKLKHLSLDNCKANKLPQGLTAATGLTELSILDCKGLRLDHIWLQLTEMLPCWPLLIEMEVTEKKQPLWGRGESEGAITLLTSEALADAQMASESDSEAGEEE